MMFPLASVVRLVAPPVRLDALMVPVTSRASLGDVVPTPKLPSAEF